MITRTDFDTVRDRAHRGELDDRVIAETLRDWATDPERFTLADDLSRADVFVEAGESFGYARDYAEALRMFEAARNDGGATYVDPRALMVQALYEGGRKDAAFELADALRKDSHRTVSTYLVLGGFFELVDELRTSQRWYSMGIRAMDSGNVPGTEAQYESMLIGRARIRSELGMPSDTLDDAAAIIIDRYGAELAERPDAGSGS